MPITLGLVSITSWNFTRRRAEK